jgi:hypothetical protein
MNNGLTALLKSQAFTLLRAALYIVSGILFRKGYISHDMNAAEANQIVGFLIGASAFAWATYENFRKHRETEVALTLPSGTSREDLQRVITESKRLAN